jgi:CelD/BcsL family acetyltransferase involved in cellulose biosynthesis
MTRRGNEQLATVGTSFADLRVAETNFRTDPRWESFVVNHPDGSIYHHPAWLEALEREYGQKGVYFVCEDAAGDVLAILPMLYTRGLPFGVGHSLMGRRLSSLPRTPVAGPLSIDSRATAVLLQEAVRRVSRNPGVQLQIKTQGRELDGLIEGVVCTPWRLSYLLRLPANTERPFRISNNHSRAIVKWAINKAARLGVYARPAETEVELGEWYRLYLETMRRNVVPPRPYRFFAALWELLKPRGMMQLLLAEQYTMGHRRIIAGSIFLAFGRTISYAFNGSRLKDLSLRPNDVIQWQAINDACRSGFRFFDLGEVPEGHDELAKFKSKWGTESVRLYRYYYPVRPDLEGGPVESAGYAELLRKAVWRRLPLTTVSWLGDRIYGYL